MSKRKKPVQDALEEGHAIREAIALFQLEYPERADQIVMGNPKPDPDHPGRVMARRPGLAERLKGGRIGVGERTCSKCSKKFYMEIAVDAEGQVIDSVGGVLYADAVLCDVCSPI